MYFIYILKNSQSLLKNKIKMGVQSAFTNTSVFDRPYFEALFGGSQFPDGTYMIDYEDEIIEFQKWYMEVLGDIRSANMFTYPVSSVSLLRVDGKFKDEDFAKWIVRHNMKWSDSNLFIDKSVTSLSNCCFYGDEDIMYKTTYRADLVISSFEKLYESFKGKFIYVLSLNNQWKKARPVRLTGRDLYKITISNGKTVILTDNHINPTLDGDKVTTDLTEEDWLRFNPHHTIIFDDDYKETEFIKGDDGDIYYKISSIEKFEEEVPYVYCVEVEDSLSPYFTLANGLVTHNCRLKSNIKDIGYFNSIGGSALKVGSVKVSTVNLARVALESNGDEDKYIEILKDTLDVNFKVLDRVRHIIKRNVEKGLLPNFTHGLIDFEHLYNTVGNHRCPITPFPVIAGVFV